ncbi:MAG: gluconate 2-dehydrogenase subunit 3 family protein [Sphingomonadaceae bacterium]|nr:gluconate 2-dehydrogenase subunit 3 family protein [Sphingomonadaceae bacterium]
MQPTRRTLLIGAAAGTAAIGLGVLPFVIGDRTEHLTPAEAKHRGVPLTSLDSAEADILGRLGDILLPGADQAGIVNFVDHHLSVPSPESLLMVRYMDVAPPYLDFYRAGLAAMDGAAKAAHGQPFVKLPAQAAEQLVVAMGREQPRGWQGPPSQLFYFVTRSDAVDVVYGTRAGFEKLGIPYMAHIEPEKDW